MRDPTVLNLRATSRRFDLPPRWVKEQALAGSLAGSRVGRSRPRWAPTPRGWAACWGVLRGRGWVVHVGRKCGFSITDAGRAAVGRVAEAVATLAAQPKPARRTVSVSPRVRLSAEVRAVQALRVL